MKLPAILTAIISVGVIAGGVYTLDATYARDAEVCRIEQRLDRKIRSDDANRWRQMMFQLEDRYGKKQAEQLPEYREFQRQWENALRELQR
jgi:hypothetical protein